jgi:ribosomal protein S18 acetylase RimI-like enzyme
LAEIVSSWLDESAPIAIRRATHADCDGILRCLRSAFAPYQSNYTPAAYQDTILTPETLRRRLQEMCVLVAVTNSGIVGTLAYGVMTGGNGHLRGMAVIPEWHGRGIAKRLLDQAELELRASQCRRCTLNTTTPLQRAIAFYRSNGYVATEKQDDFFGMPLVEYSKQL